MDKAYTGAQFVPETSEYPPAGGNYGPSAEPQRAGEIPTLIEELHNGLDYQTKLIEQLVIRLGSVTSPVEAGYAGNERAVGRPYSTPIGGRISDAIERVGQVNQLIQALTQAVEV